MAFGGKRRRVEADLVEMLRAELATVRTELQASLAESVALLSTRVRSEVEMRVGEPSALVAGIQDVRDGMNARDAELAQVLRQVAQTCEVLAEQVQLDRIERTALVDAVSRLTTTLAIAGTLPAPNGRPTVIGGTVDPEQAPLPATLTEAALEAEARAAEAAPDTPAAMLREIDLEAEARVPEPEPTAAPSEAATRPVPRDGVEVRCRFGDRWVTGFEVCEVIRFDDTTRYRLRRRSDGSVLPTLFDEKDLRFFTTSFTDH
jgi:hypothetical protein